jgi:hypothetical protein
MPNGHGGGPYFGGPIFFAIMFAVITWLPVGNDGWLAWTRVGICLLLAAAIGWRLAYYFHMYDVDDYGGAYTPPDVYRQANRRYWIAASVYAALTTVVGLGILWWRGLP